MTRPDSKASASNAPDENAADLQNQAAEPQSDPQAGGPTDQMLLAGDGTPSVEDLLDDLLRNSSTQPQSDSHTGGPSGFVPDHSNQMWPFDTYPQVVRPPTSSALPTYQPRPERPPAPDPVFLPSFQYPRLQPPDYTLPWPGMATPQMATAYVPEIDPGIVVSTTSAMQALNLASSVDSSEKGKTDDAAASAGNVPFGPGTGRRPGKEPATDSPEKYTNELENPHNFLTDEAYTEFLLASRTQSHFSSGGPPAILWDQQNQGVWPPTPAPRMYQPRTEGCQAPSSGLLPPSDETLPPPQCMYPEAEIGMPDEPDYFNLPLEDILDLDNLDPDRSQIEEDKAKHQLENDPGTAVVSGSGVSAMEGLKRKRCANDSLQFVDLLNEPYQDRFGDHTVDVTLGREKLPAGDMSTINENKMKRMDGKILTAARFKDLNYYKDLKMRGEFMKRDSDAMDARINDILNDCDVIRKNMDERKNYMTSLEQYVVKSRHKLDLLLAKRQMLRQHVLSIIEERLSILNLAQTNPPDGYQRHIIHTPAGTVLGGYVASSSGGGAPDAGMQPPPNLPLPINEEEKLPNEQDLVTKQTDDTKERE